MGPVHALQWSGARCLHSRHRELLRRNRCCGGALGRGTGLQCRLFPVRHPPALRRSGTRTGLSRASARHRAGGAQALDDAGRSYQTIDAIAVTKGPGLAGSLLVGLSYAKALAYAAEKPLIAVNHLEGHIHAVLLEERQKGNRELEFPVLALVVSGGHTHLFLVEGGIGRMDGTTMWDTPAMTPPVRLSTRSPSCWNSDIREARPSISWPSMAIPQAVKFPFAQIKHHDRNPQNRHADDESRVDFSYSGIKTAVLRYVETHDMREDINRRRQALAELASPSREDYLAACDQSTPRSGRVVPARDGE